MHQGWAGGGRRQFSAFSHHVTSFDCQSAPSTLLLHLCMGLHHVLMQSSPFAIRTLSCSQQLAVACACCRCSMCWMRRPCSHESVPPATQTWSTCLAHSRYKPQTPHTYCPHPCWFGSLHSQVLTQPSLTSASTLEVGFDSQTRLLSPSLSLHSTRA